MMKKITAFLLVGMFVALAMPSVAVAVECGGAGSCGGFQAKCAPADCGPACVAKVCEKAENCRDCGCESLCQGASCCAK